MSSLMERMVFLVGKYAVILLCIVGAAHSLMQRHRLPGPSPRDHRREIDRWIEEGELELAIDQLQVTFQFMENPALLTRLLKVARQTGDTDAQIFAYRGMIRLQPQARTRNILSGLLLQRAGIGLGTVDGELSASDRDDLGEVASHCTQILEEDGDDSLAHFHLGLARMGLGDRDRAIHHLEEALRIDPKSRDARMALRRVRAARS